MLSVVIQKRKKKMSTEHSSEAEVPKAKADIVSPTEVLDDARRSEIMHKAVEATDGILDPTIIQHPSEEVEGVEVLSEVERTNAVKKGIASLLDDVFSAFPPGTVKSLKGFRTSSIPRSETDLAKCSYTELTFSRRVEPSEEEKSSQVGAVVEQFVLSKEAETGDMRVQKVRLQYRPTEHTGQPNPNGLIYPGVTAMAVRGVLTGDETVGEFVQIDGKNQTDFEKVPGAPIDTTVLLGKAEEVISVMRASFEDRMSQSKTPRTINDRAASL